MVLSTREVHEFGTEGLQCEGDGYVRVEAEAYEAFARDDDRLEDEPEQLRPVKAACGIAAVGPQVPGSGDGRVLELGHEARCAQCGCERRVHDFMRPGIVAEFALAAGADQQGLSTQALTAVGVAFQLATRGPPDAASQAV